ncbi:MAG TPA: helix-turn-helix domain-containing protein [Bryobacteraceae bacterium]|nr:helix-turn-helix domain-containing protein [Bryobacteraceae bacterium]
MPPNYVCSPKPTGADQSIPASVATVLESPCFEKAQTLRNLLVYLWTHREQALNEYAIATEALGRGPLFDPRIDATVRVQISRLRQRLDRFYEEDGKHSTERLVIPLGTHQLQIEMVTPTEPDAIEVPAPARRPRWTQVLAISTGALSVICCVLGVLLYQAQENRGSAQAPPAFWKMFFANGKQTRVLLPTPTFFAWSHRSNEENRVVMFRDTDINNYADAGDSPTLQFLEHRFGVPSLGQSYTVTSDTFAAVRLARYLDATGVSPSVMSSASAPLEALDKENVIALGTWGTLSPLKPYLDQMNFSLGPHEVFVQNRYPASGEAKRFNVVNESEQRSVWPGVIALLPGKDRSPKTHLLILASRHTAALVSFLTSTNGLGQLDRLWRAKGSPPYFEIVVAAEMNADELVRFWPLALHAFPKP